MSLMFVIFYVVSTLVGELILPFGIVDDEFTSLLGICFNICGVAGSIFSCVVISKVQKKSKQPVPTLKRAAFIFTILTLAAFCYFAYATLKADRW